MFKVGQLVVCVDDSPPTRKVLRASWLPLLKKGCIYTVEAHLPSHQGLAVEEAKSLHPNMGCWRLTRFRPVVTPSIEVFTAMLTPANQKQDA